MGLTLSELEKNDSTFRVLKEFFKPENDVVTETYSDEKHESENKSDNDSDNFQVNAVTPFYFNYEELLAKYNRDNIDNSVIKYSNAVSNWVTELMNIICNFEEEKSGVICHCSELIRSYNIPCNNEIQRIFVEKHQSFLNDTFSFERKIHSLKNAFTRLNSEVIKLKSELKSSLFSDDVFKNLSIVEKKDRPSFVIIAESTANEVKKIIEEINSFENDNSFIENCIGIINSWVRRYCDFISVIPDDNCLKKVIEKTYDLLIPLIEREYSRGIVSIQEDEITISEKIIAELEVYRMNIEEFYGKAGSDELEFLKSINGYFSSFLRAIEDIIFDCGNYDDRVFIINASLELFEPYSNITKKISSDKFSLIYNFSGCLADESRYELAIDNAIKQLNDIILDKTNRILYHVGNSIEFGKFKGEPIKWRILKRIDNYVLAIGNALCKRKFTSKELNAKNEIGFRHNYWNTSDLREWLNEEFYNSSFNKSEKEKIKAENNDKVTLLTKEEAEKFLTREERAFGTWWWLRSNSSNSDYINMVYGDGEIASMLYSIPCEVRPVIKILIK